MNDNFAEAGIHIPEVFRRTLTGRPSSDLVLGSILEDLMEGVLQPGQRINARQLAEKLDVSIVPVREALHLLAGEGVIELLPRKGARIRTMDREEVANWWEIYRVVSALGIRGAAENINSSEDNVGRIRTGIETVREAERKTTPRRFIMTLLDFHRIINEIYGNPLVDEVMCRLQVTFWCMIIPQYICLEDYWEIYVRNYSRIAEAIMIGDADSAESIYRYHVKWSRSVILGERPDPTKPWRPND